MHPFTQLLPVWKPKFVTDLVPEDRCHLNGLAVRDGKAKYVTALGVTDTAGGWRDAKATGGVLIVNQEDAAEADEASYDIEAKTIEMTGNVMLFLKPCRKLTCHYQFTERWLIQILIFFI